MDDPTNDAPLGVIDPPAQADPKTPEAPTQDQIDKTNELLKDIQTKVTPKEPQVPAPSQEQVREMIKEKTGLSDAGVDWVIQMNRESVTAAVAPLQEKMAWSELRTAKSSGQYPVTPEIEKAMKEELKQYPVHLQGDSVLLEKVYAMSVGQLAIKGTLPKPNADPARSDNPVIRRTIVNNNPAPAGNNPSNPAASPESKLSDQERVVAKKMGISAADYAKSKANPVVWAPPEKG